MHRNAGDREIVVADRLHAHDRKEPADGEELFGRSEADRAMALDIDALQLACRAKRSLSPGLLPGLRR